MEVEMWYGMRFQTCGVHFGRLSVLMEERMWTCRAKVCQISMWGVKIYTSMIYVMYRETKWVVLDLHGSEHYLLLPTFEYTSL